MKKPFKESKVGIWLKEKFPEMLDIVAGLTGIDALEVVADLIKGSDINPSDKIEFLQLKNDYEMEMMRMEIDKFKDANKNITDRWQHDMSSTSWLSKNIRPLTLASLLLFLYVFIFLDAANLEFEIRDIWVRIYETILLTAIGGYFVLRTVDKKKLPWQK